jgi:hypothetical protein
VDHAAANQRTQKDGGDPVLSCERGFAQSTPT